MKTTKPSADNHPKSTPSTGEVDHGHAIPTPENLCLSGSGMVQVPSVEELLRENTRLREEKTYLEERIRLLESILFGKKSEKKPEDPTALPEALFNEPEQTSVETTEVKAHLRAKPGRRPLPADLPRVKVIHDLTEAEKTCACGCGLTLIGEEVTERLDIVPSKIQVIQNIRLKYACRGCEGVESNQGAVKLAPLPAQIIPQGIVTPGLLAHVIIAKYADAIPLYRQEQQFLRLGLEITRGTLSSWVLQVAAACQMLLSLLLKEILSAPVLNMDETTVQVLNEPGRANTTKSYMWVCCGGPAGRQGIIFQYYPMRASSVPMKILKDYRGYLQTDGYIGYELIGDQDGIRHLGCMAHARRKFIEVAKGTKGIYKGSVAQSALDFIGTLYGIEKKAREKNLNPEEIVILRDAEAGPVLDELKNFLDERRPKTPPKSLLGKAINYALNQWKRLIVYLEDGRLSIDNNIAENAIRPFAVGRKNWLFSASPRGAEASAALYSLIETAKANNLDPSSYLRFLFTQLPLTTSEEQLKALLPQYIDRNRLSQI